MDAESILVIETPAATHVDVRQPAPCDIGGLCVALLALAALAAAFFSLHALLVAHLCMERVGDPNCLSLWSQV